MATEKEIKKELLKQLEVTVPEKPKEDYSTEKIIKKYQDQLKRLKKYAIIGWIITALYLLLMFNLNEYLLRNNFMEFLSRQEFWLLRYSNMATKALVIISLLITYLVYHKSKTLTMLQICARLANIENYLKKMTFDK